MIKNYFLTQANTFVGRGKELADVSTRLTNKDCRLLTLIGLGGSGKTRLAIEAAQRVIPHFQQGVIFVGLQPLAKSDLLVHTIAQALGIALQGEDEPEIQLFNYLREKSLLLLLDNFEHLLSASDLISDILVNAPNVKILITSREALSLQEEWLYPIKGMTIPLSTYTTSLEDYEAVQLFLNHAHRIQPDFDLAAEHEHVFRICTMTTGLPLAIELAASWLKGLTASQIASEMRHSLDILSTTTRNVEERHRSMRAVFDQSWKLLSEDERLIFARLSVFRGGFTHDAAKQVAGASFGSLSALVEKSLIHMERSDRFDVHEMLRQYSVEKLEAYGETDATLTRHSQYFAQLMFRAETSLKQPQQLETMKAIEINFENIRLAWDWSIKSQMTLNLHHMLNGLYLFGFLRSRYGETIALFQQALDGPVYELSLLGRLLTRRWGYLHWWYQADYQDALDGIQSAIHIAQDENNTFETALGHLMAAYAMVSMQRYHEALPHLETSKMQFESINEPYYVCWVLHRLGYVYDNLNDSAKSLDFTEQSLALARVTHNRFALGICLYNLGSDYILQGNHIKGKHYCTEALQVAREAEQQSQIAHALSLLALCAFCQGDYPTTQDYAERSQSIIESNNSFGVQSYNYALLILLACFRDDYDEAIRLREIAERYPTNHMGYQLLYWALATLSCGLGKRADTRLYIQKALQITNTALNTALVIWIIPGAIFALTGVDPQKAIELLSWIWNYPDEALNSIRHWPALNKIQTQLSEKIDSDAYQLHWEKGKMLTFADVSSYLAQEFRTVPNEMADNAALQPLTSRETEILHLLAAGMTNPQIADELVIGAGTVKTHTLNIYRKLDVGNRTQAIVRAQELGLLPLSEIYR